MADVGIIEYVDRFEDTQTGIADESFIARNIISNMIQHAHPHAELTFILGGSGMFVDPQGSSMNVKSGSVLFIPGLLRHGFTTSTGWRGISVHYHPERLDGYGRLLHKQLLQFQNQQIVTYKMNEPALSHICKLIELLNSEINLTGPHLEKSRALLLNLMLVHIHSVGKPESAARKPGSKGVQLEVAEVVAELERSFQDGINIDSIISNYGHSPSFFRKVFKESTGVSPKKYVMRLRLDHAKSLIRDTSVSITQAAYDSGFSSLTQFNTAFYKDVGMTPKAWRILNRVKP
ncbi:hypothetical protein SY83_10285 [Paenibacillus swuensis]|uniref:HTH araC/xylS-type domain-containing protein n=1 Tax=Paenibacillus swuensis TaxID=1178515 RepID=A0A172TI07_9BACL|nr:AraC family transcriptional regulator [Paenibacillus swuensis]ANE46596.1 hypothetical protein SY83_10285 [Paenibacillus swuensis]